MLFREERIKCKSTGWNFVIVSCGEKKRKINKAHCSLSGCLTTAPFNVLNKSAQWFEMRHLQSWICGAARKPGLLSALQLRSGTPAEKNVR